LDSGSGEAGKEYANEKDLKFEILGAGPVLSRSLSTRHSNIGIQNPPPLFVFVILKPGNESHHWDQENIRVDGQRVLESAIEQNDQLVVCTRNIASTHP
jgi:hypothetical protein